MPAHDNVQRWTPRESLLVIASVKEYGHQWGRIVKRLKQDGFERNVASVRNHYLRYVRGVEKGGRNICRQCGQKRAGHVCTNPAARKGQDSELSEPRQPLDGGDEYNGNEAQWLEAHAATLQVLSTGLRSDEEREAAILMPTATPPPSRPPSPLCVPAFTPSDLATTATAATTAKLATPHAVGPAAFDDHAAVVPETRFLEQAEHHVEAWKQALDQATQRVSEVAKNVSSSGSSTKQRCSALDEVVREWKVAQESYNTAERVRDEYKAQVSAVHPAAAAAAAAAAS